MHTPRIADYAEFSFHARNFCEGVPGGTSSKNDEAGGEKAVKDAPERVCLHALGREPHEMKIDDFVRSFVLKPEFLYPDPPKLSISSPEKPVIY